jgi:hypothetical protein
MKIRTKDIADKLRRVVPDGAVIYAFDRVTVWLDRPELPVPDQRLKSQCTALVVSLRQMRYNPRWKLKVDIFQPTIECLRRLAQALEQDVGALITYIEIACDIPTSGKKQALKWRNHFLAEARVKYQRQVVIRHLTNWYYGRRNYYAGHEKPESMSGDKARHGDKRGSMLVVYADRPSKLNNSQPKETDTPSCHIECRSSGSNALSRIGIASLLDLIDFDHSKFWTEYVRLYRPLKPTNVGRILAKLSGADPNVSGTALHKRGTNWKTKHSINGKFVLHNALLETPNLRKQLETVPFIDWANSLASR